MTLATEILVTDLSVGGLLNAGKVILERRKAAPVTKKRLWGKPFIRTTWVGQRSYFQLCQHDPAGKLTVIMHLHRDHDGKIRIPKRLFRVSYG